MILERGRHNRPHSGLAGGFERGRPHPKWWFGGLTHEKIFYVSVIQGAFSRISNAFFSSQGISQHVALLAKSAPAQHHVYLGFLKQAYWVRCCMPWTYIQLATWYPLRLCYHMYADYLQLYTALQSAYRYDLPHLERCTAHVSRWFLENDLILNPDKTEPVFFRQID